MSSSSRVPNEPLHLSAYIHLEDISLESVQTEKPVQAEKSVPPEKPVLIKRTGVRDAHPAIAFLNILVISSIVMAALTGFAVMVGRLVQLDTAPSTPMNLPQDARDEFDGSRNFPEPEDGLR